MGKRSGSSTGNSTQPSEIPTALIEGNPFEDEHQTIIEDATLEATPTNDPRPTSTPRNLDKFRRPTKSEIANAVDQVNTEAVDLEELAQARAAQSETDDHTFDIDVDDGDED